MSTLAEVLDARWRRLDARVNDLRAGVDSADPHRCPDSVAGVLDALHDLWEFWALQTHFKHRGEDDWVRGRPEGELTAALVHARGGKSHAAVELGDFTDTHSNSYFSHYCQGPVGTAQWRT